MVKDESNINNNQNVDDVIVDNNDDSFNQKDIYNKVYRNQFIEIIKFTLAFLISQLLYDFIKISLINDIRNNKILCLIIILIIVFIFLILGTELFTYVKIKDNKKSIINQYQKQIDTNY